MQFYRSISNFKVSFSRRIQKLSGEVEKENAKANKFTMYL